MVLAEGVLRLQRSGSRWIPIAGSLLVHALLIMWLAFPPRLMPRRRSAYDELIRPEETHLVWYSFKKKLPQVSPQGKSAERKPLRAEVKLEQSIVSSPADAPKAPQMIFHPAPRIEPQPVTPLPNLIALSAPPPAQKEFVPPKAAAPKVDLPKMASMTPAPQINPRVASPQNYNLPNVQRPFMPPPDHKPKLVLPEIQTADAPKLSAETSRPDGAANEALREGSRTLAFRPRGAPSTTSSVGSVPNAPVLSTSDNSNANVAVVGLNPIDNLHVVLPNGSRKAQFSGGPKLNPNGATSSGISSGITIPDLTIRGSDRDAAATLIAKTMSPAYKSPTSTESLREAVRDNVRSPESVDIGRPSGIRVSGSPDPRFLGRDVFSVAIQMPNLTSYVGSWLMWYAGREPSMFRVTLSAPSPLHKVDPKYVPTAVEDRTEGTVRLAFVIGKDGHVYDIETVKGIDERLDKSAADALRKWIFSPSTHAGQPVDVDALVDIPFRLAPHIPK